MTANLASSVTSISLEDFADFMEAAEVVSSDDKGSYITHYVQHRKHGFLYLTSCDTGACFLSQAPAPV